MKKILKGLLFIIVLLLILLATYAALLYFNIIKAPAFISNLPYIQVKGTSSVNKNLTAVEKIAKENDILKKQLTSKDKEIDLLKNDFKELEDKQQAYKQADAEYKDKIIALNNKLSVTEQNPVDQDSIYKDMAQYFMEMNAKEAADLLSRLKDEDIIGILEKMETDSAAELLQKMPRNKAVTITRQMLATSPQ